MELHALTARLTGVDLSAGMLDQAKEKGIYNELVLADIVEHLKTTAERFDLLTAADLLAYVGNLELLFAGIRDASLPGAWFAFSTESTAAADYTLNPTGRYSHSRHYVESLLTQFGYVLQSCDDITVRTQSEQPVAGNLFVCCR